MLATLSYGHYGDVARQGCSELLFLCEVSYIVAYFW